MIFFPFSCEIKEIEKAKTCNEGMKRSVFSGRKIFQEDELLK